MSRGQRGESAQVTLQTVERALSFLEAVAHSATPLTLKDVASELGLNITTCYHLFNTLSARGYLERRPDLTVRLGIKAGALYEGFRRDFPFQQRMTRVTDDLAAATSETAWVSTIADDSVVLMAYSEGSHAVRAAGLFAGLSGSEHVRSSGRVVLAFLDEESRERMLRRSLGGTEAGTAARVRVELVADLELIRERGWALDDQGYNPGVLGVAAPFFGSDAVKGAVGIWAPAERGHQHLDALVEHVVTAGAVASALLGPDG